MSYKLLTYMGDDGPKAGVFINGQVYDAAAISGKPNYKTVLRVLEDWSQANLIFQTISKADGEHKNGKNLADVQILAPIQYPGEIWAAGANYQDHIKEMGDSEYKAVNAKKVGGRPWHFSKTSRGAVVGHGSVVQLPQYSKKVDWEIELAAVIGRPASNIAVKDALNYVAGYTIANDLSARDFVAREGIAPESPFRFDWLSHKGFDGSCPMGPWITPAEAIINPQKLDLKLWIDDELMQDSNTEHMIFSIAEQIEEISARVTMYPGDVILSGTPSGVGMGRGIFLKSGQNLRLWIQDIGELTHSVI